MAEEWAGWELEEGYWKPAETLSTNIDFGGADAQPNTSWYGGLLGAITATGRAVSGVIATKQGVITDPVTGRIVSVGGQPVYNYDKSTLSGVLFGAQGMSLVTLALIGGLIYLLLRR